jgi:dipeptide/tripeptide permease
VFWAPVLVLTALTLFRLPETLLLLRLQDLGVAVAEIPLVWAGLHLVRTVSSYPGGWVSDRLGQRGTVALGGIVFALGVFILGRAIGIAAAISAFLLLGLVAGLTESAERAVIAKLAPKRTGRGFGVYYGLAGFVSLPAAFSFGLLYQRAGAGMALSVSAALMTIAALLWLTVARVEPVQG